MAAQFNYTIVWSSGHTKSASWCDQSSSIIFGGQTKDSCNAGGGVLLAGLGPTSAPGE
jgi:hypothetical protein